MVIGTTYDHLRGEPLGPQFKISCLVCSWFLVTANREYGEKSREEHYQLCHPIKLADAIPSALKEVGGEISRLSPRLRDFDETAAKITQVRGKVYADPNVDFDRVMRIRAIIDECQHPLVRHVLGVLAIKMSRLIHTPDHLDSWIDIAGYARCGVMVTEPGAKYHDWSGFLAGEKCSPAYEGTVGQDYKDKRP